MDPEAAWGPCEFQLASWALEEPAAAEVWVPTGLPVEYAALDIFGGTCSSLPWPYAPESSGGQQQLVEQNYYYSVALPQTTTPSHSSGMRGWGWGKNIKDAIIVDVDIRMEKKMHRYPASLQCLDKIYTVPRIVAIGPYHHRLVHLKKMEKVKRVAALHCAKQSCYSSLKELYCAVDPALDRPHRLCLYDKDAFNGISDKGIRKMMFRDACFLVQYILIAISGKKPIVPSLHRVLSPKSIDIHHDVMLLENQLPWDVVRAIMKCMLNDLEYEDLMKSYIYTLRNYVQDKDNGKTTKWQCVDDWDSNYEPPHLLGLVRYYTVARRGGKGRKSESPTQDPGNPGKHSDEKGSPSKQENNNEPNHCDKKGSSSEQSRGTKTSNKRSHSVSAIELAEIGIEPTPNDTTTHPELMDMRLDKDAGTLTAKLYLPPLSLNIDRASYLVNMAALELCTVESFSDAPPQDTAVCSYLRLLAVMVSRVEDVHELRERGVLHGGGGLTNEDTLKFFTSLQSLRLGSRYTSIMEAIENYKLDKQGWTTLYKFVYKHKKAIAVIGSGVTTFATVVGTLASIKQAI
ncbi:hypothetical protein BS78_05G262100 [Paspalum vaginatum]|nr:hypothetical protein BS78_05G262100 [Paspalum vaginatum]